MKKILVPIDFSETAENAFMYALEMAKVYEAELVLLHTFDLPIADTQLVAFNYAEIYDALEVVNSNQFDAELNKLTDIAIIQDAYHIKLNHLMMSGDLVNNIKEVVAVENIDFVVMGTNGGSGWFDSMIGTKTCNVMSDVSIPVLSISNDAEFHKIETIGFTTLYRDEDMDALTQVLSLARKMKAKVKCLYVETSDCEFRGQAINYWDSYFKNQKDLEFFMIPSEDVEATIEDFIANQGIDLLAMVTHKKNFFTQFFTTSTTQLMSQHSKTPILAIHE